MKRCILFIVAAFAIVLAGCSHSDAGKERKEICKRFKNAEAGDFIRFKNESVWFAVQKVERREESVSVYFWTPDRILRNFANEQLKGVEEILSQRGGGHVKWEFMAAEYIASHP